MRRATCILAATIGIIAALAPVGGQRGQTTPAARRGLPPLLAETKMDDLTAAQKATALGVLERIERLILQEPELASPKGFEVLSHFGSGNRMEGLNGVPLPNSVASYGYNLSFYSPTVVIAREGRACISAYVNFTNTWGLFDQAKGYVYDENGRYVYLEPPRGDPMPLATQVYGHFSDQGDPFAEAVILTSGGEPYWKAVSRDEYYKAMIFVDEKAMREADLPKVLEKTGYQRWMEGAAERRKLQEDSLRAMAQSQPASAVAKLRKELEDNEREITESLRASERAELEQKKEALAMSTVLPDRLRAELQAMTPAQRNLPAIIDSSAPGRSGTFDMTDRDSPSATRVLTPSLDFWRIRKSPVEVRSIAVVFRTTLTCAVPAVRSAITQARRKLDWAALNNLLDVPR